MFWNGKDLVVISRNVQGILKRCRGLFSIRWKGLVVNIMKVRDFFAKGPKVEGLFNK